MFGQARDDDVEEAADREPEDADENEHGPSTLPFRDEQRADVHRGDRVDPAQDLEL